MPFKSKQQVKFLYSQKPELAKKWREEFPRQDLQKLPKKVKLKVAKKKGGSPKQ
jgi:hypothetical protein